MRKEKNEYIKKWEDRILKASKALKDENFILYETLMDEVNEIYKNLKQDSDLQYECKNFGTANYIFEDALPKLFKKNKKAVKEFIMTIKEDKNLLSQFQFFKALEKNNKDTNTKEYINEALVLTNKNVNLKTIKESIDKLNKIIRKYNIKPNDFIPQNEMKLFEDCHYVFTHKKNVNNLLEVNEKIDSIVNYTKENYNAINESKVNYIKLIEEFEKKYKSMLTEDEQNFIKEIISAKQGDKNKKKENLFNKFKNECIKTIDKVISESSEDDKDGLMAIKEQISSKIFCEDTLVKDIAKLLEIRDILLDE